jgi:hypothetical protein
LQKIGQRRAIPPQVRPTIGDSIAALYPKSCNNLPPRTGLYTVMVRSQIIPDGVKLGKRDRSIAWMLAWSAMLAAAAITGCLLVVVVFRSFI